jgi:hypothetical protein
MPHNNRMELTAPHGMVESELGCDAACAFAHRRRSSSGGDLK